eukprot:1666482-Rhodomonas_salina.2
MFHTLQQKWVLQSGSQGPGQVNTLRSASRAQNSGSEGGREEGGRRRGRERGREEETVRECVVRTHGLRMVQQWEQGASKRRGAETHRHI